MQDRTYDDFVVGEAVQSHGRTITETDLVNFTCFAGIRLPMFIDEEFARRNSIFGTRVIPGLMTASIAGGMLEGVLGSKLIAAMGLDAFKFSSPVKIGDTLHTRCTVTKKKDLNDPTRGILSLRVEVCNQNGATPAEFSGAFMMRRA